MKSLFFDILSSQILASFFSRIRRLIDSQLIHVNMFDLSYLRNSTFIC